MTGLKLHRLGFSVPATTPSEVTQRGDEIIVVGFLRATSLAAVEELVQQALGLGRSGADRWGPMIASHNPRLDGVVEVLDVEISDVLGASPPNGNLYRVTANVRRFPSGHAMPWCESILTGALRVNAHSIAAGDTTPWHGVPSTVDAYSADLASAAYDAPATRAGEGGTANIYVPGSQAYYDAVPAYFLPLDHWYDMAPVVKIDGHPVVGAQTPHEPDDWSLENQLLRVRPGSGHLLDVAIWSGTAWETVGVELGYWSGGAPFGSGSWTEVTDIVSARVVRTGVGEAAIAVTCLTSISSTPCVVQLSISLRRGSRFLACQIEAQRAALWGVRPAATYAATTAAAGVVHQTGNNADGNRLAFLSPADIDTDGSTGTLVAGSSVASLDVGIAVEVGGTGSADPDRVADLRAQYFAAQGEVVEPVAL